MVYLCIGLPPEDINFLNHPLPTCKKCIVFNTFWHKKSPRNEGFCLGRVV